jgi:hypothetical protein
MKLLSIFFQNCCMKVFEPMNVYEKCKVFMCSMRCSDNRGELLCMIKCLNEILLNKEARKEIRIILLKEHLSYLLKLTSVSNKLQLDADSTTTTAGLDPSANSTSFLSLTNEDGLQLIASLLDLLESMVFLMGEESPSSSTTTTENETLTIYVHILAMYLNEPPTGQQLQSNMGKRVTELNDLVIQKIFNLGKNHKQELKQILDKWPMLKVKFTNGLKLSTSGGNASQHGSEQQQLQQQQQRLANKTPKIQLSFNFSKK